MQASQWAEEQFGQVQLGDRRRTQRVIEMATAMFCQPGKSLPQQMGSPAALKASYRLLNNGEITYEQLLRPHWQRTRSAVQRPETTLLVQDTTELDYTMHRAVDGLGPIGNGDGRGMLLQSMLAICPRQRVVLGLAHQLPTLRQKAPKGESRAQRRKRDRESQMWLSGIETMGRPPTDARWVHVGDRYADMWSFFATCQRYDADFLVRAAQDRRVVDAEGVISHVFAVGATLPPLGERTLELPARPGRSHRFARLVIAAGPIHLLPPRQPAGQQARDLWLIWVHEQGTVPDGEEPLHWVLVTSVPTLTEADAWERVEWYRCRWIIEEYHQCLKTGCGLEQSQLETRAALERLLAFIAVQAIALLQLRDLARAQPEQLAALALPEAVVRVVAYLANIDPACLTVGQFWKTVAQKGGFQGRKGDGAPGWKTLWRGWLYIQTLLEGIQLAAILPT